MKDDIAERLLAQLMGWDVVELKLRAPRLQALATLKYDEYGQYRPGAKFAENLGIWLRQFDEGAERATALEFVESELLFITDRELSHIIELAYPDLVEKVLTTEVATQLDAPPWRVNAIRTNKAFRVARRRSLFLGLSDGARLDRFRRASPQLSHEQFAQEYEVADHLVERMTEDLSDALDGLNSDASPTFERVWLIDDFSGSGRTLIRLDDDQPGSFKGKIPKFSDRLADLVERGLVEESASVDVLLYLATDQAVSHVNETLKVAGLEHWTLHVVYRLPPTSTVDSSSSFADLCRAYYDNSTEDDHKDDTSLGYSDCALPLVLGHNTPNNSVCLLWAETGPEGLNRRALFPRYERHHRDRQ